MTTSSFSEIAYDATHPLGDFPLYPYALIGYLIGSIPFGLVLSFVFGYGDIRKIGSGNIGATNVLRTGNKLLALATLVLDGGKGAFAVILTNVLISAHFAEYGIYNRTSFGITMAAGLFAILGHMFPVWLKFKGGKGVATTLGMLLALAPTIGALSCLVWLLTAALFRYSSLAALAAVFAAPPLAHFIYADPNLTGVCGVITVLVWFKHRANIKRLAKGEEPKIGKKT